MERFVQGRRAESRALHPRYYALHPQSTDKKLRKATWQHFSHTGTGVTFRLVDNTHVNFRLPRGHAIFPVYTTFYRGASLTLDPSARLRSALPDVGRLRITVDSASLITPGGKTGQLTILPLEETRVARITGAGV